MDFDLSQGNSSIIKVIGVGGSGCNAVNHMFDKGINAVDFVICNTDEQALKNSPIVNKIQLGETLTQGLGAGNDPNQGREAAIESYDEIAEMLSHNAKMVFVTAGMGGGTGTGAAPVIAQQAKEMGILTVGIVTLPFRFEGKKRQHNAIEGLKNMRKSVDALLIIDNEKIREIYGNFPSSQAFGYADDILTLAAKGIAEIITVHGIVNVDFADVKTVMTDSGIALMGSASACGENRAVEAIEKAMHSPLLNNNDIRGAKNILLNIISSSDHESTMDEVCGINDYVQEAAGNNADIIWGNTIDDSLGDALSVTIIATGFNDDSLNDFIPSESAQNSETPRVKPWNEPVKQWQQPNNDQQMPWNTNKPTAETENRWNNQAKPWNEPAAGTDQTTQPFFTDFPTNNIERLTLNDKAKPAEQNKQVEIDFDITQFQPGNVEPLHYDNEQQLQEMENQPAYLRQQNAMRSSQDAEPERSISHLTLSDDGKLRENNSFLYDNVD